MRPKGHYSFSYASWIHASSSVRDCLRYINTVRNACLLYFFRAIHKHIKNPVGRKNITRKQKGELKGKEVDIAHEAVKKLYRLQNIPGIVTQKASYIDGITAYKAVYRN